MCQVKGLMKVPRLWLRLSEKLSLFVFVCGPLGICLVDNCLSWISIINQIKKNIQFLSQAGGGKVCAKETMALAL